MLQIKGTELPTAPRDLQLDAQPSVLLSNLKKTTEPTFWNALPRSNRPSIPSIPDEATTLSLSPSPYTSEDLMQLRTTFGAAAEEERRVLIRESTPFSEQDIRLVSQQSTSSSSPGAASVVPVHDWRVSPTSDGDQIETVRKFRRKSESIVITSPDGDTV
jgi:NACalpha-BTF3-like transcription factor